MIDTNDQRLMLDYAHGDVEAFEALYSRYKQPLYQYMINSCDSEAVAGELFQDVWTKVIGARKQYCIDAPFKAWLFRIARNTLTDHYRKSTTRKSEGSLDHDPADGENLWGQRSLSPDQVELISQRSDYLQSALAHLPEAQREAIVLKHVAGMSIDEIAQIQKQGAQTIKSRLRYAVKKLRAQLEESL